MYTQRTVTPEIPRLSNNHNIIFTFLILMFIVEIFSTSRQRWNRPPRAIANLCALACIYFGLLSFL